MRKKILVTATLIMLMSLGVGTALAIDSVRIFVNGTEVVGNTPAQIINGRTMVPIRLVAEALNATVDYDALQRKVIITTASNDQQDTWKLMKVNGEMTTWPYWEKDGNIYMEYRNCIDLLEMKYKTPWHKVDYSSISGSIIVDQKKVQVYTKTIGDFNCISLNDLKRSEVLKYEWNSEERNLTFE